jgi:hypothetical protein
VDKTVLSQSKSAMCVSQVQTPKGMIDSSAKISA